jgi:hypothetical protein
MNEKITKHFHDSDIWSRMENKTLAYFLSMHADHPHTLDRQSRDLMLLEAAHRIFDWESPEGQAELAAYRWSMGEHGIGDAEHQGEP